MLELHPGHDERVRRRPRHWHDVYQEGELTLAGLGSNGRWIAAAVRGKEAR